MGFQEGISDKVTYQCKVIAGSGFSAIVDPVAQNINTGNGYRTEIVEE